MHRLLVGVFVFTMAVSIGYGQSDRGTITGTISDPTKAVIPGATVVAKNGDTGVTYETVSTETGNYTLGQLPAGLYQLSVELPGFKKYIRQGITVLVAQTLRIDVGLDVGAAGDEVTVNADAPLLRTESSDVSHNVAAKVMDDLPILGIGGTQSGSAGIRNPYAMVEMVPGTVWTPNALVRVNGTPANSQSFRLEGQEASNTGTPGVQAQNQPSVDAIQEVAIQTSNFAAEYGQVGGGLFNITMKSGTNQFHGTAYDYFVNEVFNAGNPLTTGDPKGNPRPRARRNDYGFTVGGPVDIPRVYDGHGKTFFFMNFEQYRESTTLNNLYQTVPTLAYRRGDFSQAITGKVIGTDPIGRQMIEGMIYDPTTTKTAPDGRIYRDPFLNNFIDPKLWDPVATKIQALFPLPSGPFADALTNNFLNPNVQNSRVTTIPSVKLDQTVGTKGKFTIYWQRTKTENPNGNPIFGGSDGLPDPITQLLGTFDTASVYRINYDYTLSPTKVLHLGAGYRDNFFLVPSVTTKGVVTNYDAEAELGLHGGITHQFFPPMSGLLATTGGGMRNFGGSSYANAITQSPSFNVSLAVVKNNHSYKYGAEFRTEGYPPDGRGNTSGSYTFAADSTGDPFQTTAVGGSNVGFGYGSFLLGLVKGVSIANPTRPRLGKKQLGLYAQDSWKVTPKLTLDYGLRYDYSTYLREEYGRAAEFSPTTPNPAVGGILGASIFDGSGPGRCNCDIAHNYPYAFGPRLGIAYQVLPKTVFRLGVGIVYGGTATNNNSAGTLASSSASVTAGFGQTVTTLAQGIPVSDRPRPWPTYDPGLYPTSAPIPGASPVWMDPNAGRPPRQVQWSIGFQREVAQNLVVEATYIGNRGVWWQAPGLLNLNANTPERLKSFGLDITNSNDRTLLGSPMSNPLVSARFNVPYAGFPTNQLLAQALRPFPQFTNIPVYWNPMGKTWYDALQIKATKRLSHGLSLLSTFAWSKSLTIGSEIGEPNPGTTGGALVNNVFNRYQNKYLSQYDQPFLFNTSVTYTTPRTSFKTPFNKALSAALGDWTYGAFLQYASGMPMQVPLAQSNLNNYLFQGQSFANRKPGVPLFTVKDINCHCYDPNTTFVLNKDAWYDPDPGTFGSSPAYYNDYRKQRRPVENMNLGRRFQITEKASFNLRIEFTNVFNRAFWGDPGGSTAGAALTQWTLAQTRQPLKPGQTIANTATGFGMVPTTGFTTTQNLYPRQGVLVGRFTF
jgi:hypothetical protein